MMEEVFRIGTEIGNRATTLFEAPNELEFEKVFYPYLLLKKKRYAGMKYEGSHLKTPTLSATGIEIVRRDKIKVLREVLKEVLYAMLRDNDFDRARAMVVTLVQRFVAGQISVEDVETSQQLKAEASYERPETMCHVQVVKQMKARKAFGVPGIGDRVPFVILETTKKKATKASRAEHPDYVARHNLKIDRAHYLQLIRNAFNATFEHVPIQGLDRIFDRALGDLRRQTLGVRSISRFAIEREVLRAPLRAPCRLRDGTVADGSGDGGRQPYTTLALGDAQRDAPRDAGMTRQEAAKKRSSARSRTLFGSVVTGNMALNPKAGRSKKTKRKKRKVKGRSLMSFT
jgi:hypothetical protein